VPKVLRVWKLAAVGLVLALLAAEVKDDDKQAVAEQLPIVVYCGFDGPRLPDTVCVRDDDYPGVKCPAVVVGYPLGDRLKEEVRLAGQPTAAEVAKAASAARRKMDVRPMPKAKESAWKVSADRCPCESCSCGPACSCGPGKCDCPGCDARANPKAAPAAAPQGAWELVQVSGYDRRGRLVVWHEWRPVAPAPASPAVQPGPAYRWPASSVACSGFR
jgi:hypothetical protein